MLRPAMYDILNKDQCYYSFVIAVAKRAREIVDEYMERGEILEEKSVDIAVKEFAKKDVTFIENSK
ncbi:MAG: DNA-directed RNA polymerase subunit omega [Oscillospiraceae bacterium]|nr:DNA-directed RNA polymerase subunit omega [Oscillospiraceae bacterium]